MDEQRFIELLKRNGTNLTQAEQAELQAELDWREAEARALTQAERAAKAQAFEAQQLAQLDAELAPHKRESLRDWLIEHPGATEADFEKVWPLVREKLLSQFAREGLEADLARRGAEEAYHL